MNHITIVVPTRNRITKLQRMIESIPQAVGNIIPCINLVVVVDHDNDTVDWLFKNHLDLDQFPNALMHMRKHCGSVVCRNAVMPLVSDGLLYATDDIVFHENSIISALTEFNQAFPNDDGVLGWRQQGNTFHPTGIALVGKKFLDRYPERKPFYPKYYHFSCQEIYWLADKLGKFIVGSPACMCYHYHPDNHVEEMDETHKEARKHRAEDHALMRQRQEGGQIWGQ
jgi:glycosyltransferase involved in cell wall biosynthesis